MKNKIKFFAALFCVIALLTLFIFRPMIKFKIMEMRSVIESAQSIDNNTDKIHFLNTGSSDAILLESDGHYALVDAAEDSDNPRGFEALEFDGYEQKVLDYLKKNAADENGIVHLDFILGTHSHSDHIGGFDTIINDKDVVIDKAFLKVYDSGRIREMEIAEWDNQEVYDQMVDALNSNGIPIISNMDSTPFTLGNFTITLFNTDDPVNEEKVGENDQSIGVLVEKKGARVFLAADIDNITGDEDRLGAAIGKIDLLKVGHHSYSKSTTSDWLISLMPKTCIVTNEYGKLDMKTIYRITRITSADIFVTGKENGIIATIDDNGEIKYYNDIH